MISDLKLEAELFKQIGMVFIGNGEHEESLAYLNKSIKNIQKLTGRESL
jgi:hypothetical protein